MSSTYFAHLLFLSHIFGSFTGPVKSYEYSLIQGERKFGLLTHYLGGIFYWFLSPKGDSGIFNKPDQLC